MNIEYSHPTRIAQSSKRSIRVPATVKQRHNSVTEIRSSGAAVLRSSFQCLSAGSEIMSSGVNNLTAEIWSLVHILRFAAKIFSSSAEIVGFCWLRSLVLLLGSGVLLLRFGASSHARNNSHGKVILKRISGTDI